MLNPEEFKIEIPIDPEKVKVGDTLRMSCPKCASNLVISIESITKCVNGCCTHLLFRFECECGIYGAGDIQHMKETEKEKDYARQVRRHRDN